MLKIMRKHAKYFYFLFFMVIISFVFWGIGTVDKTGGVEIVAEVGKYKITTDDYWHTYKRVYDFYREIYKDKFDEEMEKKMNLKENVLDSMINERALLIAAKEAGIGISDEELQESITHEPAFMKNGIFDKDVYLNRLRLMRITPEAYESSKRQERILKKVRRLIELSVDVSDINLSLGQVSGDEKVVKMLGEQMLIDRKEKAIRSYIEGLKKQIKIKINKQLIA
ncbi:MAG: SurA N-terminal domain-containing protein [Nitrospirota bacterium]